MATMVKTFRVDDVCEAPGSEGGDCYLANEKGERFKATLLMRGVKVRDDDQVQVQITVIPKGVRCRLETTRILCECGHPIHDHSSRGCTHSCQICLPDKNKHGSTCGCSQCGR